MDVARFRGLEGDEIDVGAVEIDEFAAGLDGRVVRPSDPDYDEMRSLWNGMIDRRPALIARCAGTADVARAMAFAAARGLLVSVRGGGHNIAGNAVADGGLMIDLADMNAVEVDAESRTARVEPGATLGDVDRATAPHGLATPTGINSTTGIAGLTLGGGFGWLTRSFGLTIDNLIAVEIVTPDGAVRRASATEEPDLFWGVRGGGGNFGIVTSFEFRLHEVGPDLWCGLVVYSIDDAPRVLEGYRELVGSAPDEQTVWVVMRQAPPLPFLPPEAHGTEVAVLATVCAGDPERGRALSEPLTGFAEPLGVHLGRMPFAEFQTAFDPLLGFGARNYWKSHDLGELSDPAIEIAIDYTRRLPDAQCEVFFAHLGGAMRRVGPEETAYRDRDVEFVMNVHGRWDDAGKDDECIAWARSLFADMTPHASGGVYVNFLTEEESGRVEDAYGDNLGRLRALKRRFDPSNLLRMNQNIRP